MVRGRPSGHRKFLAMKRIDKAIQNFLFLAISLFIIVLPAFHQCHDLMDAEIFSPPQHFEVPHPEQIVSNRQDNWEGWEPGTSRLMLLLPQYFSKQFFYPFPPHFSFDQRGSALRC